MSQGILARRWRSVAISLLSAFCLLVAVAVAQDLPVLLGTDGNDTITGTPAAESVYARAGSDTVNAGGGDDELDGGPGGDVLGGGDGVDVISYTDDAPVTVSLNGVADDGAAGEGDNVGPDVEDVLAGGGADKLIGSAAANLLDGGAGDDRIEGGGGRDTLLGGDGDDTIIARDGAVDRIDCGAGDKDTAVVDFRDVVIGCDTTTRPAATRLFRYKLNARGGRVTSVTLFRNRDSFYPRGPVPIWLRSQRTPRPEDLGQADQWRDQAPATVLARCGRGRHA